MSLLPTSAMILSFDRCSIRAIGTSLPPSLPRTSIWHGRYFFPQSAHGRPDFILSTMALDSNRRRAILFVFSTLGSNMGTNIVVY